MKEKQENSNNPNRPVDRHIYPLLLLILIGLICSVSTLMAQTTVEPVQSGADQFEVIKPYLEGRKVGVIVNQTSYTRQNKHLVDLLLEKDVELTTIFAPEHGFKGKADAGEHISDGTYGSAKIPIYSLYGNNKKPTSDQLKNIDILIFDIQDVGARFYTYISTMHYAMEACAENNVRFLVLDRPNPMGMYVDGPVLDLKFQSFVGMHPIPVVHGLTVGELAKMINGEKWLKNNIVCDLGVVPCKYYTHQTQYNLPIKPSPNLPDAEAIRNYPSLCLFEGTKMSVGRGTYAPFLQVGYPGFKETGYQFTPKSIPGMSKYPKFENQVCNGYRIKSSDLRYGFDIRYLLEFYQYYKKQGKTDFFNNSFFDKLAGSDVLRKQIIAGKNEYEIRAGWQQDLNAFKLLRSKYLMYPK